MQKIFELVDENGNPKKIDLFSVLKEINDNIEFRDDGVIVFHLPPNKASTGQEPSSESENEDIGDSCQ